MSTSPSVRPGVAKGSRSHVRSSTATDRAGSSSSAVTTDELIERLRERAADPERRIDVPQSKLGAAIEEMGLGDMFAALGSLAGGLGRVIQANQAGRSLDADLVERADRLEASMTTPVSVDLPGVADTAALGRAEALLGRQLPRSFRRIYGGVADGGFGPGTGLLSLEAITTTYAELVADPPAPRGLDWPEAMIPLVDADPGFYCLELPSGRVIDWDPQETSEGQDAAGWANSFTQVAPDLETWLGAWVSSRTPAEERQAQIARFRREEMQRTRDRIAAMTPAEREAVGLPAEDWEAAFIDDEDP